MVRSPYFTLKRAVFWVVRLFFGKVKDHFVEARATELEVDDASVCCAAIGRS